MVRVLTTPERDYLEDLITSEGFDGAAQELKVCSASYLEFVVDFPDRPVLFGLHTVLATLIGGGPITNYLLDGGDTLVDGSGDRLTNG